MCRDKPEGGPTALLPSDFFMSRHIEDESNSVESMIGKAVLCTTLHAMSDAKDRLVEGRRKSKALLACGTSGELGFTDSDDVYLCRWFYAQSADEGFGTEIPETGRLVALTEEALLYFLKHSSPEPDLIYDKLYHQFMRDGARSALHAEEPRAVRERYKLGAARPKKRPSGVQGGGAVKEARVAGAGAVTGARRSSSQEEDVVEIAEAVVPSTHDLGTKGRSPRQGIQRRAPEKTSENSTRKEPPGMSSGKSSAVKESAGKSKTVSAPSKGNGKAVSTRVLKPGGDSSAKTDLAAKIRAATARSSKTRSGDIGRGEKLTPKERAVPKSSSVPSHWEPESPKSMRGKAWTSASSASKAVKSKMADGASDGVAPVPSGGSMLSGLKKWGITDASSDPEPVQRAANKMTGHLSRLNDEQKTEVADLWRLLVRQLHSIRLDPNSSYTDEEYEIAQAKALEDVCALRESKKNAAALSLLSRDP